MVSLSEVDLLEAAVQIMLRVDRCITLHVFEHSIAIQFPTTRKLADYLNVPHYYILPYFAIMEQDGLITRVERVGISTTQKGTRKLIAKMATSYREQTEELLGHELFMALQKRIELVDAEQAPSVNLTL